MEHKPVKSSSVASVAYDPHSKSLEVRYHGSGKTYSYADIPYDKHLRLMTAKSIGKYVSNVIQKEHKATLIHG